MLEIRSTIPGDYSAIMETARQVGVFTAEEVRTVAEVLDLYLENAEQDEFLFISAEADGRVVGFACYGRVALTQKNYELNWIATAPDAARRGVAGALLHAVEEIARAHGARFLNLETSATSPYAPARAFYDRHGYAVVARLPDYYADGDDMLIYRKAL